jgi:hypothetical protein
MSTNVLEGVLEIQRQRAEAAEQSFRDLVTTLAGNPKRPPTPESIDSILIASRHSVADLADAVKLVQRRESLRAEIRDIDARNDDRAGLQAKIEAANVEFEAAKTKHWETVFPIQREIESINLLHHRRAECERELRSLIDDDAAEEIDNLDRQIRASSRERDSQKRLLSDIQGRLSSSSGTRPDPTGRSTIGRAYR